MSTTAQPLAAAPERRRIAPLWHTLLLVLLLVGFSFSTAESKGQFSAQHGRTAQYLVTMVWEWALVAYVWFGVRRGGYPMREVIGGRWKDPVDPLLDVASAVGFWIAAALGLAAIGYAMGLAGPSQVSDVREKLGFLVPQGTQEVALWIALSMTAGFCEEIIFRGYLQKQLGMLARSAVIGVAGSAVVFGAAHAYEGPKRMVLIGVYGIMFGVLAEFRKSLRPGMMAHAWHDVFTGMVLKLLK